MLQLAADGGAPAAFCIAVQALVHLGKFDEAQQMLGKVSGWALLRDLLTGLVLHMTLVSDWVGTIIPFEVTDSISGTQ